MPKSPRIDNETLLSTGLEMMRQNGRPLTKVASPGRSMIYCLPNGETVRVRTCNDHVLIVVSGLPSQDAKLNIEGTKWLLVVMPEIERTAGNIIAYLIPTEDAVKAARQTHQDWLDTNPNTKGNNTTWNLWFRQDGPDKANGYAEKWSKYLIGAQSSANIQTIASSEAAKGGDIKTEVEAARQRIAKAANVSPEAVKITIDFSL